MPKAAKAKTRKRQHQVEAAQTAPAQPEFPRGKELLRQVVNKILECPGEWDQKTWHCGTKHCVGGWAQILGGRPQDMDATAKDAMELIGLSQEDAAWLFSGARRIGEIHAFATAFVNGKRYYNQYGYNRDGYDRAGYNRDGYDRDGYNRDGYNRDGERLPLL